MDVYFLEVGHTMLMSLPLVWSSNEVHGETQEALNLKLPAVSVGKDNADYNNV